MTNPNKFPIYQVIDGTRWSAFVDPELFRKAATLETKDGDIIEVTFPRSGTHWVQQIIQLLLSKGEGSLNFVEFAKRAPFLEYQGADAVDDGTHPRVLRTHLPMNKVVFNSNAKYVYVARNPWDCCVSLFHFLNTMTMWPLRGISFDDFVDLFLKDELGHGDFFDHIISGYERRDKPNMFFITYEELKADTAGTILRLAKFLGDEYGSMLEDDKDLAERVLAQSSVQHMKTVVEVDEAQLASLFVRDPSVLSQMKAFIEKDKNKEEEKRINFVRKGAVGSWKGTFTKEQLKKMLQKIEEVSTRSDVMKLWQDQWTSAIEMVEN